MPRYKSRVGGSRRRKGGNVASGGSIQTGGSIGMQAGASGSVSGVGDVGAGAHVNLKLPDYKHLSSHLHAAHTVLNTRRKTWRLVQHAAALHAGD